MVDGDTYDILVDLGFQSYQYVTVRLKDVDTPEIRGPEREQGLLVKAQVEELILNKPVIIVTSKDPQTFGRYVADVLYWDGYYWLDLGERLRVPS